MPESKADWLETAGGAWGIDSEWEVRFPVTPRGSGEIVFFWCIRQRQPFAEFMLCMHLMQRNIAIRVLHIEIIKHRWRREAYIMKVF